MAPTKNMRSGSRPVVKQMVKSMLEAKLEQKRYSVRFGTGATAAGLVTPISQNIIQGDGIDQRAGNRIYLNKLNYTIAAQATTANTPGQFRVIIFEDKLNTGSVPAVVDVLTSANSIEGYQVNNLQSHRFKIIRDWFMPVSRTTFASGDNGNGTPIILIQEKTHKLRDPVQYNAATSVAGANGMGALFMLFIDTAAVTSYTVGLNLTFTDA